MINLIKKYFKKLKAKILAAGIFVLIIVLLGQAIWPLAAQAANPQFNTFTPYVHTQTYNRDYYLLDVKNETKNTDWNFPVSADAGDVLVFYLYYHNAVNYTIAQNTTLRINMPLAQGASQIITGYLWADNASNATLSNPLNQSVQVNLSSPQKLEYIVGSAKWYPNQADWRTAAPTPFPNSQPESQLFGSGINLGSIEGCWEFSGAIVFKARATQIPQTSTLTIDKKMRNVTRGEYTWSDSVQANPRQTLATQLIVANTGSVIVNNVIVRDALPNKLIYNSGSTRVDGAYAADGIVSGGINIGSLAAGQSKTIYFEANADIEVSFPRGTTNLVNAGFAKADNASEVQDSANIIVDYNGCSGQDNRPPSR